jgi:rare lipoprotein A
MDMPSRACNPQSSRPGIMRPASAMLSACAVLILAACGSAPQAPDRGSDAVSTKKPSRQGVPALPRAGSGRGGYYRDDGPGDDIPDNLLAVPDAEPKIEPYLRTRTNQPYDVFGKTYYPKVDDEPLSQRGRGSWYGKKFHGQRTSSGEPYDMYKMTAAHPTLPIPSYARVTNLANGNTVIVRVNDRGPFHADRIIDLSYTAAFKLGYLGSGSAELKVERILPDEIRQMEAARKANGGAMLAAAAAVSSPAASVLPAASAAPVVTEAVPMPVTMVSASMEPLPGPVSTAANPGPVAAAPGGHYLQLGAYSRAENAQSARDRHAQRAGSMPNVEVVQSNGLYRVFGGPYASRAEAEAAARQLQTGGALPIIVQR